MAKQRKSRLVRNELETAKKQLRNYILATGVLIVFGFFFGLPLVTRFAAFVHDITAGDSPIEISDKTPPAPPHLSDLPEFTNKEKLEVNGISEPGSTVKIFINSKSMEAIADNDGKFNFELNIRAGENKIYALSIDENGNESQETAKMVVTYDNEPPEIEIIKPQNGDSFYGNNDKQINIEGKANGASRVTINDRIVILDSEGKFSHTTGLESGTNDFIIKARDAAGNETEINLSVVYSE